MSYYVNHNYDSDQFEEWADELDYFTTWAEIEYDDDDEEVDDEWLEWSTSGACATKEVAELVSKDDEDEWNKTEICDASYIDFDDFLGKIRDDGCFAVLDGGEPVAIVFYDETAQRVAKHVAEQGGKPTIECTYEYKN